jgi:hypothetical protein
MKFYPKKFATEKNPNRIPIEKFWTVLLYAFNVGI